ncbi:MFS transporter [Vibrio sp. JC009]|uniref:MFS transporter n=1 Tax=Vibrio sp. JC009 TaxID=2912314 RepID=UPI0023B14933|nr:MFS transporter [Vibrio sp. JC009]WED24662.1 MFS transporter [Vibrio sp. JC009]
MHLFLAQVTSLVGTGVSSVCLALLAYDLAKAEASSVLSTVFAIKMIAYIGFSPLFGVIATRLPARQTLITLDIIRAAMFAYMPFVTHTWEVYILIFIINTCSAGFTPLYSASLPKVLPDKDQYTKALSFSRLAYDLEQVFSPVLTSLLLGVISFRALFWFDSFTFIISGLLIVLSVIPTTENRRKTKKEISFSNTIAGINNYLASPKLRALWYAYIAAASASAMVLVNTVVYVQELLQGGETQTALAMLVAGLGSMLVALKIPSWLKIHQPQRYQLIGIVLVCLAFAGGAFTPDWMGFILVYFVLGAGMSCIQTPAGVVVNEESKDEDSAPYFAAHFSLTHFWWLITYLVSGFSASWFGLSVSYLVMMLLSVISLTLYLYEQRRHKTADLLS